MSTNTLPTSAPPDPNNPVLYIQNLPEKLPKPTLRRALYTFFAPHGPVLAITACKTRRMRGQAHILFRDITCAAAAMRASHGQEFLGRTMRVGWSRNRSKILAVMRGGDAVEIQGNLPSSQRTGGLPPPQTTTGGSLLPQPGIGLPAKAVEGAKVEGGTSPGGVKRGREESDGEREQDDAPMEEDDDEGAMEMSDDDD